METKANSEGVMQRRFPSGRARLIAGTAIGLALAPLSGALAQSGPPGNAALEEIIVTGSRIARPNLVSNTPVAVLGEDLLDQQGLENFADIAQTLPQFAPSFGASRTQSTFSGAATSGLNTVNLRNLGVQRSVVLINGRRVPYGSTHVSAVDFNMVPTANVERVEVITGGAAAVYGADAVAGVINIITKQDFEGLEVGASYGIAEEGDNENPNLYAMFGSALGDRGHVNLTLEFAREGEVSCADRYLCAEDFAWFPPDDPIRGDAAKSTVGLTGRFFVGNQSYTRRGNSFTDANGKLIPFQTAIDGYNRNADRTLAIPTKRVLAAAEGRYEIADGIEAFAEFNYGSSETNAPFEGHPFQSNAAGSRFGGGPGVPGLNPNIPIDNPFIPQALRDAALAAGQSDIVWWQRFNVFEARGATNDRQILRTVAGLRGDFDPGFGDDWRYEASYTWGRTNLQSQTNGLVSTERLYHALHVEPDPARPGQYRCVDAGARAAGCIPVNPFADYTEAMKQYLTASAGQRGKSEIETAIAYVSGSAFELPAGPVGIALGVESRKYNGYLDYDDVINRALVTGNQLGDVERADINADEVFGEIIVPVLADLPFADSLNLEGAYRYTDGNIGDSYSTWKIGGDWAPVPDLRFRVVYNKSVRTPNPSELGGLGQTFGVVNDPCIGHDGTGTVGKNCLADGVPVGYNPPLTVRQSVGGFVGGNPDLEPEKAKTLTYGFVATPQFLPGFSLTVDRFQIKMDDVINTVGRQLKANLCYQSVERRFCDDLTRTTDPTLPGATWVLKSVNDQLINVAALEIRGVDIEANYAFDVAEMVGSSSDLGNLALRAIVTWYDKAGYTAVPGEKPTNLLGSAGGDTALTGYIRWTGNASALYRYQDFDFSWNMRYIGDAAMAYFEPTRIDATTYHNVRASYNLTESMQVYGGVTNLFDNEPPFFASGTSGTQALDTIPAYYDVFGRSYYAGVRMTF